MLKLENVKASQLRRGDLLVYNPIKFNDLLKDFKLLPYLSEVYEKTATMHRCSLKVEGGGGISDLLSPDFIENNYLLWQPELIVYCGNGNSRFCIDSQPGFYFMYNAGGGFAKFLGKELPGRTQEELHRALKNKAFW